LAEYAPAIDIEARTSGGNEGRMSFMDSQMTKAETSKLEVPTSTSIVDAWLIRIGQATAGQNSPDAIA